jgi:hypothetical protein
LFANWGKVAPDAERKGFPDVGPASEDLTRKLTLQFKEAVRLLGMAVAESPEIKARKRRRELELSGS